MNDRDIRSLDVGMLRAFSALMRERSVSRAAELLCLSQPAVSASLRKLRAVFDDTLFQRVRSGVEPTPRAQRLAPMVERTLGQLNALLQAEAGFDIAQSERVFRVLGSTHASLRLLPGLTRQLSESGSRARLSWEQPSDWPVAERLRRGALDLALFERGVPPPGLECLLLQEDEHVLVASTALRGEDPLGMQAFCELPHAVLSLGNPGLEEAIDAAMQRTGATRRPVAMTANYLQLLELVANAGCLAVLPRPVLSAYAHLRHPVRALSAPFALPPYRLWACWSKDANDDPGHAWLRGWIVQTLQRGAHDVLPPSEQAPQPPLPGG
jgi:DNA-binding transcriptional LysR family regulator